MADAGTIGLVLVGSAGALGAYPYLVYPALLRLRAAARGSHESPDPVDDPASWPRVSVCVPVYNERAQIDDLLDSLLALEYPGELEILIVSDASSDGTDARVEARSDPRLRLFRLPTRTGKTEAENIAAGQLRGDVVVNTDASIRIHPTALVPLVAALRDPGVGVASGRDVSVARGSVGANQGESGYVGYEMWLRALENRVGGIVGASGCLYAIRRELHLIQTPPELSRDFVSALNARERGFRAVSVNEASCTVPRTGSLFREYRRKVRTLTRGMSTLRYKRSLLNPFRFGTFSWMLWSHKVGRWATPWAASLGLAGIGFLAVEHGWARWALVGVGVGAVVAAVPWFLEWRAGRERDLPKLLALPAYAGGSLVAAAHAAIRFLGGKGDPVWEPTRREASEPTGSGAPSTSPRFGGA